MAFLGPMCCQIRDIPTPSRDNGRDKIQLAREMKAKENGSCFVAYVTVSNLKEDILCLPQEFTSANGFTRKCIKIFLIDGKERSWALDLKCNSSVESFYIPRGWRNFCIGNGKKVGDSFMFKLEKIWEMFLPSVCPMESNNDDGTQTQGDKNHHKESCVDLERKKNHMRLGGSNIAPNQNRFMTLEVGKDGITKGRQYVSVPFMRRNGIKPGLITLLGKDGTKWMVRLRGESFGRLCLGKGWRDFCKANGLKMGVSFTMESISENGVSMLKLFSVESTSYSRQLEEERRRDELSQIQKRFVTLRLARGDVSACRLTLPSQFMKANGIDKLDEKITILGRDGMKFTAYLLSRGGLMAVKYGWEGFCKANGVKIGESFTLEFVDEKGKDPILKFRAQVFL